MVLIFSKVGKKQITYSCTQFYDLGDLLLAFESILSDPVIAETLEETIWSAMSFLCESGMRYHDFYVTHIRESYQEEPT